MSKDELHSIAQADSPNQVSVPNNWQGLIVWAVAQFGSGVLFAGVFAYATCHVYQDMRSDRAELFSAYQDTIRVMSSLEAQIEKNTKAIDEAYRRVVEREVILSKGVTPRALEVLACRSFIDEFSQNTWKS